jgi:DNA-directed RNA polymerase beta' subunit
MLSPEEIRRNSVVEITSRDTYESNKPVIGGLFDPRMGVLESGLICPTDGLTYIETPGYFGHIELARPVFFIQHLKEIMKICKCVCYKCSKLLINKTKHSHIIDYSSEERWKYVYEESQKIKRCGNDNLDGCGYKQPDKIKLEQMANIIAVWENIEVNENNDKNTITMKMTPEIILKIFKRISDEDVFFMGFHPKWSRPDWMICSVLPVPPPSVRPSVKHDAQQRSEDDLTHIYSNIIKTNTDLLKKIKDNAAVNITEGLTLVLQYYIAMVVNNKVKGSFPMAQRSGRPLQCIMGRLNSKTGRIRGNLMGKRVNYSARSVITGDPNLSIEQLGVPLKIAKNLTKPVKVNIRNIKYLTKLVQNGPDVYPGAKTLEKKGSSDPTSLRNVDISTIQLEVGDVVHRHIMDGDIVLFNRQPSLHRMSMMAHEAKILYVGDTFRMNVAVTKPYNADFDGDEMNAHFPQNVLAETELRHLAAIPYQLIDPGNNSPIIGIFQDSMLGSYRFTRSKIDFDPFKAMNMLMMYRDVNVKDLSQSMKNNNGKISNFDIISQVLPPLTMEYELKGIYDAKKDDYKTSNNIIEIRNGKYIRGQINKGVINGGTKGLIHRIHNDFGNFEATGFINNFQNIITEYMKTSSYSVGISDLIASKDVYSQIGFEIEKKKMEVQDIINEVHLGIFKNVTANSSIVEFESRIHNLLNDARRGTEKIAKESLNKDNRFAIIVESGSKGTVINITQMIACLGQQDVDGKRIPYGFDSRTLPHYSKFDDSANARGFIENSYISGLTSQELFFHAMAGRIGLIDTAVKSVTWETPIVIIENGLPKYIEIGKWIDEQLDTAVPDKIQHFKDRNMELMNLLRDNVYIPTTDEDGNVSWGEVSAITRHDPGEVLYEIKTSGGRKVIVTESKSLLIWNAKTKKLVETLTPEIVVGDCVPATGELCLPPILLETIDMTQYFSKLDLVELKKSKFPENFELNEPNGIFIGVFLAKGNVCETTILMTNLNENIKMFVKSWFDNYSIDWKENKSGIIIVKSFILSTFLKKIVGNGSVNKHVPSEAFISNENFIIGLLNGYFSCNGNFSKTWIDTGSKSYRLMEGISMLCSRLGIYCRMYKTTNKIPYHLSIGHQWSKIFSQKITLLEETKNKIIKTAKWGLGHKIFDTYNNIVLDTIIEINLVDVKNHPKVYDLTIPTTLNFGLANGLQVRDTSTTGYIQRRLIKGLEDLKVEYDMTVRNSVGKIIQFRYGGDGFDSTKVEGQGISLVNKSVADIYSHYHILGVNVEKGDVDLDTDEKIESQLLFVYSKETVSRCKKQITEAKERCKELINTMITARNDLVVKVFKNKDENGVNTPIGFAYLISNIQGQLELNSNHVVDITPLEALQMMDYYYSKIQKMVYSPPTELFKIMYYYYLSPKELLVKKRFHKKALTLLLETILLKYKQAIVHPGEMVGIIAGQSLGGPTTQLTLNTFHLSGVSSKSNVTRGVPRIEEIIRLTKNPKNPSMTVYLKEMDRENHEKAKYYGTLIEHTKLVDIVQSMQICFDPFDEHTNIKEDELLMRQFYEFEKLMLEDIENLNNQPKSKWIIRMVLSREIMLDKNITMDDVHFALKNSYEGAELNCVFSDYNMENLVFRIRVNSSLFKKTKKQMVAKSLDQSDEIYLLKNFQDSLLNNIVLRGITGIENVIPRKLSSTFVDKKDGKFELINAKEDAVIKRDLWILDTTGTNLLDTLALDFIDSSRTFSNDIKEVFDILGIEAAREMIYNEFNDVMSYSGVSLNYHHLNLLCDRMTSTQGMTAIYRSGILNDNIGPIAKATFEVHTEVLLDAARHANFDPMRGISANVMCGQYGYYGTNAFNVLLDLNKLTTEKEVILLDQTTEIEKVLGNVDDEKCSLDKIRIASSIGNIKVGNMSVLCNDDDFNVGF